MRYLLIRSNPSLTLKLRMTCVVIPERLNMYFICYLFFRSQKDKIPKPIFYWYLMIIFYHVVFKKKKYATFLKFRYKYFTYPAKNFFNWLLILIKLCFFKCTDYVFFISVSYETCLFLWIKHPSTRFWTSLFWSSYSHVFSATIVVDNRTTHVPGNVIAVT